MTKWRDDYMDPNHLKLIRQLPSCVSLRTPCEAHHLRVASERGVGLKATDRWAVPLTADEHRDVHKVGGKKEEEWFADRGIECYWLAENLWKNRGDLEAMEMVIRLLL